MIIRACIKGQTYYGDWNEKIYGITRKSIYLNNEPIYFETEEDFSYEILTEEQMRKELFFMNIANAPEDIATFFQSLPDEFYNLYNQLLDNFVYFIKNDEAFIRQIINRDWDTDEELKYVYSTYSLYSIAEFFTKPDFPLLNIEKEGNWTVEDVLHMVKVVIKDNYLVKELALANPFFSKEDSIF